MSQKKLNVDVTWNEDFKRWDTISTLEVGDKVRVSALYILPSLLEDRVAAWGLIKQLMEHYQRMESSARVQEVR